jgi:hypothetical protein
MQSFMTTQGQATINALVVRDIVRAVQKKMSRPAIFGERLYHDSSSDSHYHFYESLLTEAAVSCLSNNIQQSCAAVPVYEYETPELSFIDQMFAASNNSDGCAPLSLSHSNSTSLKCLPGDSYQFITLKYDVGITRRYVHPTSVTKQIVSEIYAAMRKYMEKYVAKSRAVIDEYLISIMPTETDDSGYVAYYIAQRRHIKTWLEEIESFDFAYADHASMLSFVLHSLLTIIADQQNSNSNDYAGDYSNKSQSKATFNSGLRWPGYVQATQSLANLKTRMCKSTSSIYDESVKPATTFTALIYMSPLDYQRCKSWGTDNLQNRFSVENSVLEAIAKEIGYDEIINRILEESENEIDKSQQLSKQEYAHWVDQLAEVLPFHTSSVLVREVTNLRMAITELASRMGAAGQIMGGRFG